MNNGLSRRFGRLLALSLAAAALFATSGSAPGAQQSTELRGTRPAGSSATLMPDGQWLVVGGVGGGSYQASAYFWNPATDAVAPVAGTLLRARADHSATLLPN